MTDGWDSVLGLLATRIVVNSRAVAERFPSPRMAAKVRVVYNGVDLERFAEAKEADVVEPGQEFAAGSGDLLAMVGRLTPEKDFETYLRAVERLCRDGIRPRCLVVGSDPADGQPRLRHLQDLANKLGIAEHVLFAGNRDAAGVMRSIDVLVHCAHIEGFGRVLAEAMAAGVPVVATAVGGISEVVADGETGFLVGESDHEAVASAVARLLRDPERRRSMGAAAICRAREKFGLDAHLAQIQGVYSELTLSRCHAPGSKSIEL